MIIDRDSDVTRLHLDDAESVPADGPDPTLNGERIDDVAVELRALLSLRTRTSARDRHLPSLTSLLPEASRHDPDNRFAALTAMIDAGIAAMPDADHTSAADALLGSGSGRWRPLSARGPEAAAPFGCGWDAFRRRRRSTGSSLLEETVDLLARTLLDLAAFAPTADPSPAVTEPSGPLGTPTEVTPTRPTAHSPQGMDVLIGPATVSTADTTRGRPPVPPAGVDQPTGDPGSRAKLAVTVAVVLAAVSILGATVLAWSARSTGEDYPSAACGSFDSAVGTTAGTANELEAWAESFRIHVEQEGLLDTTRCASDLAGWQHGAIQRVSSGESADINALLGSSTGEGEVVVLLGWSELRAFGRTTAKHGPDQGAPLGEVLGPLVARSTGPDGERVVRFADGLLITEASDSPTWAIVGSWVEIWEETGGLSGGLGRPVGDRATDTTGGGLFQQFERGVISSSTDGTVQVVTEQDHYRQSLPEDPRNQVLATDPGDLWWYVDAEGVRHLVFGSADRHCVERTMAVPVVRGQSPAAIASLPAGDRFECP